MDTKERAGPKENGQILVTRVDRNTHQNVAVWKSKGFRSREQILTRGT